MSDFNISALFTSAAAIAPASAKARPKRPAPFSIRFTTEQRAQLQQEAGPLPLGEYIKAKALGTKPIRRRAGPTIEDRQAMAQLLSMLGASRYANNLNQLAHLANIGLLAMTEEERLELAAAIAHIAEMRRTLMAALGTKAKDSP